MASRHRLKYHHGIITMLSVYMLPAVHIHFPLVACLRAHMHMSRPIRNL